VHCQEQAQRQGEEDQKSTMPGKERPNHFRPCMSSCTVANVRADQLECA
jgi:hypothetical protein